MKIKLTRKLIAVIISLVLLTVVVPAVSAYEGHLVDIRAHVKGPLYASRTWGYWKTHYDYTYHVFYDYLDGSIDIGWRHIDNIPDLMGIFWAHSNKNSDGSQRDDDLCEQRLKTAQRVLAAILNSGLPNHAPLPITLSEIQIIFNSGDIEDLEDLHDIAQDYNEYYDNNPIEDCDYLDIMNNTCPKKCLEDNGLVNYSFADCP